MIYYIGSDQPEISYQIITQQPLKTGWDGVFSWGFGNTGDAYSTPFVSFYGESGKLYDQEGNYFNSYDSEKILRISGNIFSGYHNYFFNGKLIHDSCTRIEPNVDINAVFTSNFYTGFGLSINGTGLSS